jgi:hypothetical protein
MSNACAARNSATARGARAPALRIPQARLRIAQDPARAGTNGYMVRNARAMKSIDRGLTLGESEVVMRRLTLLFALVSPLAGCAGLFGPKYAQLPPQQVTAFELGVAKGGAQYCAAGRRRSCAPACGSPMARAT